MNLKSRYNFKEKNLASDFGGENYQHVKKLLDSGFSFTTLAMPGVGVSYFLRFLATRDFAYFIHVDIYSLSNLTKLEFFKLLLVELGGKPGSKTDQEILQECQKILSGLAKKHSKIVIIFNRFDQLHREFDQAFFANIRSLRNVEPDKITMIFTSNKPLYELAPEAIMGANLNFYSKFIYFKPYSEADLKALLKIAPVEVKNKNIDKLVALAGGHAQLFSILMNSQKQENLMLDHFVKLQMKELLDFLSYHHRKLVQNIALGKKVSQVDEYLLDIGMVKKQSHSFELFTPLLASYIKSNLPLKLPVKERRLFRLLRNHYGQTVSKEEIFNEVWSEDPEAASNWSLDALIYRLRNNPSFTSQGYVIESQKKVGYILYQI